MPEAGWIAMIVIGLLGWAAAANAIVRVSPRDDVLGGLTLLFIRLYVRLVHRLRVEGRSHIPRQQHPGPLIVVANHTSGVDPLLIQSACPFEIRWIMAEDMRVPAMEPLWKWARIIFVDRLMSRTTGVREAVEHLRGGGVVGVFPEGHLERPTEHVLPFLPGVGMLIARTGAPVLPVVVDGTPRIDPAWASLWKASRSRVQFHAPIHFGETGLKARDIAPDLRRRYLEWTGWPANEKAPRLVGGRWVERHEDQGAVEGW